MDKAIVGIAAWLSRPIGFLATVLTIAIGLGLGIALSFNDHWSLLFNLFLSIAALLIAGLILVAGAKDTAAIQAKLDELLKSIDEADDRLVGLEKRTAEEMIELFEPRTDGPSRQG